MLGAVIVLGVAASGLCVAWLVPRHVGESTATFALDALEEGRPQYYRPFNMGYDESGRPYGMYLLRTGRGDEVIALFSRDPHPLACSVTLVQQPNDGTLAFDSACSGSRFDLEGELEAGVSPRALDRFAVEVFGAGVDIDVTELILGRCASVGGVECSSARETRTEAVDWPGN